MTFKNCGAESISKVSETPRSPFWNKHAHKIHNKYPKRHHEIWQRYHITNPIWSYVSKIPQNLQDRPKPSFFDGVTPKVGAHFTPLKYRRRLRAHLVTPHSYSSCHPNQWPVPRGFIHGWHVMSIYTTDSLLYQKWTKKKNNDWYVFFPT